MDTQSSDYTQRLTSQQRARWKRYVPNPYRWWIRALRLGTVLDVGCGIGRTLVYLDGDGVGIDHNETSVTFCRSIGLTVYTPEAFVASTHHRPEVFDALVVVHVLEHLLAGEADDLLVTYLPFIRPGGKVVLVTPQERGFSSDPTHTDFVPGSHLVELCRRHGLAVDRWRSFPLPRWAGRLFVYNEFNVVATVPHRT